MSNENREKDSFKDKVKGFFSWCAHYILIGVACALSFFIVTKAKNALEKKDEKEKEKLKEDVNSIKESIEEAKTETNEAVSKAEEITEKIENDKKEAEKVHEENTEKLKDKAKKAGFKKVETND